MRVYVIPSPSEDGARSFGAEGRMPTISADIFDSLCPTYAGT